ncbi:MAG TPA: CoA-binding protein [Clostridiales bacterium]|nr:CoA-binding protein [Clostridiales bacterium]
MSLSQEMLKCKTWAVVGASIHPDKFGYKIYKKLKDHGYRVYPVNPGHDEIDGDKCYHSLSELPERPEVIDMVVNPRIGIKVIEEAASLGIQYIWLQPGTHNAEIVQSIEEKGMQYVKDCVLAALK